MPTPTAALPQTPETVAFRSLHPQDLKTLNARHGWSLNLAELVAIQAHFQTLKREPTLAELETLAQTWSEHCKHTTFPSPIRYNDG